MPLPIVDARQPSAGATIEVAVLEDDLACRRDLASAIEQSPDMHLVWQSATLGEARQALSAPLDVLVLDLGLPDGSGLELIAELHLSQPNCAVMVNTMFGDDDHLFAAVRAGALGYLLKDVSADEIVDEIRSLHAGGSPINPMMARKLLQYRAQPQMTLTSADEAEPSGVETSDPPTFRLSLRETQVLQLVARGHILDEVATQMGITRHTARSFVRRVYQKLQVNNRVEAVRLAIEHGLLDPR